MLLACWNPVFSSSALVLFEKGEFAKAIPEFEAELKGHPEDFEIYNYLGACYYNLENSVEAEDCYRNALRVKPDYCYALINLSILYVDQENHQKLWQIAEKLIQYYPDRFYGYLAQAYCFYKQEKWEMAKLRIDLAYRKIGKSDPVLGKREHDYLYLLLLDLRKKITSHT